MIYNNINNKDLTYIVPMSHPSPDSQWPSNKSSSSKTLVSHRKDPMIPFISVMYKIMKCQ